MERLNQLTFARLMLIFITFYTQNLYSATPTTTTTTNLLPITQPAEFKKQVGALATQSQSELITNLKDTTKLMSTQLPLPPPQNFQTPTAPSAENTSPPPPPPPASVVPTSASTTSSGTTTGTQTQSSAPTQSYTGFGGGAVAPSSGGKAGTGSSTGTSGGGGWNIKY